MLSQKLTANGYILDQQAEVWTKPSSRSIDYNDGEASELRTMRLLQVSRDLRTGSDDLADGMIDWPSTIHLSSERANLLRPINGILKGHILEVGPGAGALTRYLGENGGNVVAVEGNRRRAEIVAQRCRDLRNVHVVCGNISNLDLDIAFDAIVLVGVLEYTRIFDEEPGAIKRMLAHLRSLLAPDGYLIIGIENQLGLKYFAGAAEDHVNEAFFGISDLYDNRSAVTFGRQELENHIRAAGYGHVEFLYPFPDYKLPRIIIPQHTFSNERFGDIVEVIRTIGTAGKQFYWPTFSESLAWRAVGRNGLGEHLANSFLVLASRQDQARAIDPRVLAYTFSADRRRCFQIENRFVETGDELFVKRTRLFPDEPVNSGAYCQRLSDGPFISGQVYVNLLHSVLQKPRWTEADVRHWAKPYFEFLLESAAVHNVDSANLTEVALPENFLDFVPSNLVVGSDGRTTVFDLEWIITPAPTIGWVFFRGLFYSLLQARAVAAPADAFTAAIMPLVLRIMSAFGCALDSGALESVLKREEAFQREVVGERSILQGPFWQNALLHFRASVQGTRTLEEASIEARLTANIAKLARHSSDVESRLRQVIENQGRMQEHLTADVESRLRQITENQGRMQEQLNTLAESQRESVREQGVVVRSHEQAYTRTAAELWRVLEKLEHIDARIAGLERPGSLRVWGARAYNFLLRVRTRALFRLLALRFQLNAHNREVIRRLRSSGLFDAEWYLQSYPDIAPLRIDLLIHYLLFGAAENRDPNPLFDSRLYLDQNGDVGAAGINPLWHFLCDGAREGRNPHPHFDTARYLEENADVRESGVNPLAHYLRHGKAEGRTIHPVESARNKIEPPRAPDDSAWQQLQAERHRTVTPAAQVDVIIPVYRGYDETLACIHSVLTAPVQTPYKLVVVDDCSPEPALSAVLGGLADSGLIQLIRNSTNLGFVGSVNRGMSLHSDRDVILLNSDTIVYNDWLDRLRSAAVSEDRIGTATPFSNNATICSYPRFVQNNDLELELDFRDLDRLTAEVNARVRVPVPTAVGFCMYVRRQCLAETGLFDAARFGKGYGEENDFCLRASQNNWRHVLAADVLVRHQGAVSFTTSARTATAEASKRLLERYPNYDQLIAEFIRKDPIRQARRRLDMARLQRALGSKVFLLFANPLGGGTDHHVMQLANGLRLEGVGILFARSDRAIRNLVELTATGIEDIPNLGKFDLVRDRGELISLLHQLNVELIHVQHTIGFDPEFPVVLPELAADAGIPFDVSLHDYTAICPRVFLVNGSDEYCGEPPVSQCDACVERNGSRFGVVPVGPWRQRFACLLTRARRVYVPSSDVATRLQKYFPTANLLVRPHPESIPSAAAREYRRTHRTERRVALLGAIGRHKGYGLLRECADDANRRRLPLRFVVIGYTENDRELAAFPNISVVGRYSEDLIQEILAEQQCDLAWFPSIWPETYSYTLSHAFRAGLYPVAFDLGAPAERIRAAGWGKVLPTEMIRHPRKVNDELLSLSIQPATPALQDWGASYAPLLEHYYGFVSPVSDPQETHVEAM